MDETDYWTCNASVTGFVIAMVPVVAAVTVTVYAPLGEFEFEPPPPHADRERMAATSKQSPIRETLRRRGFAR